MLNGTRSGSEKLTYEYFEKKLVLIWVGSASAEILLYGISTESIEDEIEKKEDNNNLITMMNLFMD